MIRRRFASGDGQYRTLFAAQCECPFRQLALQCLSLCNNTTVNDTRRIYITFYCACPHHVLGSTNHTEVTGPPLAAFYKTTLAHHTARQLSHSSQDDNALVNMPTKATIMYYLDRDLRYLFQVMYVHLTYAGLIHECEIYTAEFARTLYLTVVELIAETTYPPRAGPRPYYDSPKKDGYYDLVASARGKSRADAVAAAADALLKAAAKLAEVGKRAEAARFQHFGNECMHKARQMGAQR